VFTAAQDLEQECGIINLLVNGGAKKFTCTINNQFFPPADDVGIPNCALSLVCDNGTFSVDGTPVSSITVETCFSGDTEVQTENGMKTMRDVRIGDRILAMVDDTVFYAPVLFFAHRAENDWAQFYRIETSTGEALKLSADHLIYTSDCKPESLMKRVYAKNVAIGDCVFVLSKENKLEPVAVREVTQVYDVGVFAPITSSGTIVVNNMLASCYTGFLADIHQIAVTLLSWMLTATEMLGNVNAKVPIGALAMRDMLPDLLPSSLL